MLVEELHPEALRVIAVKVTCPETFDGLCLTAGVVWFQHYATATSEVDWNRCFVATQAR